MRMMTARRRSLVASLLVVAALAATSLGSASAATPAASAPPGATTSLDAPEPFPRAATECAGKVLDAMSLEERVGQLFLLGIGSGLDAAERSLIQSRHLGSVTFAAFVPDGTAGVRRITDAVQALATPKDTHHVGFLVAANQEGGKVQALSGTGFSTMPTALRQGKLTPERLREDARTWGQQLGEAGVNLNLAPVGDTVPTSWASINAPIGQLQREFGHSPRVVEPHVKAFIEGMHEAQVLATVKHFPGLGRVRGNTDFASGVRDTSTTRGSAFLVPFRVAVDAGVPFVMTSLASYSKLDGRTLAAFSKPITSGMLRDEMGFKGVIVSDDLSAVAVRKVPAGQRAVKFLRAGGNMITVTRPRDARAMATTLVHASTSSPSFRKLVDASARRILEAKESAGLLTCSG
jgi:beta-N-acetylhexosaminidase